MKFLSYKTGEFLSRFSFNISLSQFLKYFNLHLEDVALAFPSNIFFKWLHFLHDVFLRTKNISNSFELLQTLLSYNLFLFLFGRDVTCIIK